MKKHLLINSLVGGGAERQVSLLARTMEWDSLFMLGPEIEYDVGHTKTVSLSNHPHRMSAVKKTFYLPWYGKKLRSALSSPSLVLSFLERSNFVNVLARKKGNPLLLSQRIHPSIAFHGAQSINKLLIRLLYPKADCIISNSQGTRQDLIHSFKIPEKKICVIPNAVDEMQVERLSSMPLEEGEQIFSAPTLLHAGRLCEQKGHFSLLKIFRRVKALEGETRLLILGEGKLQRDLVSMAKNMDLKTCVAGEQRLESGYDVYFLGFQKNPFAWMRRATLFVFPSFYEGFPNVLLEAMMCGKAVLSSDCLSGPREILCRNFEFPPLSKECWAEYGVLLPPPLPSLGEGIEKIWANVITELLQKEFLRREYEIRALQRAKEFSLSKILPQWEKLIRSFCP